MSEFNPKRARAKRPCPLWVDAFQRDTQHLSADEVGAYMLILMAMWTREACDFPDDDRRLAAVSRVSSRLWKSRISPVIREFFAVENGALISKRLRGEATYVERQVQEQSDRKRGKKADKSLEIKEPPQSEDSTMDTSMDSPTEHPSQQPNLKEKEDTNVSSKNKRGNRISESWELPREWGAWAVSEGWSESAIRIEAEKFLDHWISQPGQKGVKLNWQATWRNWMRNSKSPRAINGGQNGQPSKQHARAQAFIAGARGTP